MTTRRRILVAIAATVASAGTAPLAAATARTDGTIYTAIAAYRDAWATCSSAAETAFAAEARASARRPAPLPDWSNWLKANRPRVAALRAEPSTGPRGQAVLAELEAAEARPEGLDEAGRHQFARRLCREMLADREDGYAEARPVYEALQMERGNAITAIDNDEGLHAAEDAAAAAYGGMLDARSALLAARPATSAGFVAKIHALLTIGDDPPGDAIGDDEVADLICDAVTLAEKGGAA